MVSRTSVPVNDTKRETASLLPDNKFAGYKTEKSSDNLSRILYNYNFLDSPTSVIQPKLEINEPGDKYEQEADTMAEKVMRMIEPSALEINEGSQGIQRKCAECEEEEKKKKIQRKENNSGGVHANNDLTSYVSNLGNSGTPLSSEERNFFEPRFGFDFSKVRIHNDAPAANSAISINAHAYTYGNSIVFNNGKYSPDTISGKELLAHELAHVVQQKEQQTSLIRRFVPCTRARMSLEECPKREIHEIRDSTKDPMIVEYIESPEIGYVIANFGVGKSTIRHDVTKNPNWSYLIKSVSNPDTQWQILGLSDCHGEDSENTTLRKARAAAALSLLPAAASKQIISAHGASIGDCLTDNTSKSDRTWNRSVLFSLVTKNLTYEGDDIEATRPVPKPQQQSTEDCSKTKKDEIAQAYPIAIDMVNKAIRVLDGDMNPDVQRLLNKYFNDSSTSTYIHVRAGFARVLNGLKSGTTIECENKGSWFYNHFCGSGSSVTLAYVRGSFGLHVHICEAGFGRGDLDLAGTLIHECSHMYDFTDDEEYCWGGCSPGLSRWDAYDNADSFSQFAKEAYTTF